jgi:phosphate transport system substrate-binding protein
MTWLLVHKNNSNSEKGAAIKSFLQWALSDGQKYASALSYAPLPETLANKVLRTIGQMQ